MEPLRRRAQPSLGTLVNIEARCADEALFIAATDAAFARIAVVHTAMSFHEAASDLRALARVRAGTLVRVTADTHAVLRLALQIEQESGGAFNACCADELVNRGVLP